MALTKISTDGVKDNAVTAGKIPANAVGTSEIADEAVTLAKLPHGTSSNNGKFLRANNGADPTFESLPSSGATLSGSTNNTVVTVTGANAMQGEANLTFDGSTLAVTGGLNATKSADSTTTSVITNNGTTGGNVLKLTSGGTGAGTKIFEVFNNNQVSEAGVFLIDGSGKVGIGETTPLGKLHVKTSDSGGSAASYANELVVENSSDGGITILTGNNKDGSIAFGDDGSNVVGRIIYNHQYNSMQLRANGLNPGYELRSDSKSFFNVVNSNVTIDKNNTGIITNFVYSGNSVGTITISNSSTAYNTSSDYRLKENVTALTDGITRLKTLKPYRFNFISDKDTTVDGFLAHEVTAVPEAITGTKDEVETVYYEPNDTIPEGKAIGDVKDTASPVYQGIDQSKLVPLLTAALQEAIAKIETLETKVAALEAG